jgi:hypothetical protein
MEAISQPPSDVRILEQKIALRTFLIKQIKLFNNEVTI